ncbi:hypothetical protein BpHYR1_047973 [Brachionus plicatilis]|uniref:Uncharacterized protein n=1 Tax=Brachionus plicatilis TaxID=10195 RepID=A0A3M7T9L2_BRAPC|nr:hypothetical protein BpHYR1_047973 [Brachionus plicatilis]
MILLNKIINRTTRTEIMQNSMRIRWKKHEQFLNLIFIHKKITFSRKLFNYANDQKYFSAGSLAYFDLNNSNTY